MNRLRTIVVIMGLGAFGAVGLVGCGDDDDMPIDATATPDVNMTPDAGFGDWTLEDPAPNGWQFVSPKFDVAPGEEIQDCYFIAVPDVNGDGTPVNVNRIKTAINPGSHHVNVFRVKTIVLLDGAVGTMVHNGECFKSANWADWPLVANSQNSLASDPYTDWTLPANVAHVFLPGEKLMVQMHYVNASSQETPYQGHVGVNFYKDLVDPAPMELGTLFATQQSIRICQSNPQPSFSGTCSFPPGAPINITAANGHFHSRGKEFRMWNWDGVSATEPAIAPFYDSQAWDEPPMSRDLTVVTADGGGVWWTCDYQWSMPNAPVTCDMLNMIDLMRNPGATPDCCYTFGGKVEQNEHCNSFVYYYPKVDRTDITCF